MALDIYSLLLKKFSADVIKEERERERRRRDLKQQTRETERRHRTAKKCFLAIALVGVACAICFARALGGLAADMASRGVPDPSLRAPPPSKAKLIRELSQSRNRQKQDLEDIMR